MLYRRGNYFHHDFTVAGRRFRGSTRQTVESRARKIESKLIAKAEQNGPSVILRRAPLLSAFGPRFLDWVNQGRGLADNSRRYYRLGWRRLQKTPVMGMTLDRINAEEVDQLQLSGSPSYVNQALRTETQSARQGSRMEGVDGCTQDKACRRAGAATGP